VPFGFTIARLNVRTEKGTPMGKTASHYARIVIVLLAFWGAVLHYMMLIPPFEGSDEREHFGYVTQLRGGAFPDPRTSLDNLAVQASAQAPMQYILVTLWSRLAPDYRWDGDLPHNPWRSYVRPLPGNDNPNFTLFGPDQLPFEHNPNIGVSLIWLRFVSAFEGMLTVALAYITARLLLPRQWVLFTTVVFSFNSVLVQIFALLTNDCTAILFGIACTYCVAVLLRRKITPRALLLTGCVVGLGTLTKLSVLVFVPVAGVVVLLYNWPDWKTIIRQGIILAIPVALIGGPWYLYQGIAYGDPLGIEPHLRMNWAHIPARSLQMAFEQDGVIPLLTLWSGYAWALLTTQPWIYLFNLLLLALAGIGYIRAGRRLWRDHNRAILVLGLAWAGILIAYLRWWTMFTFMNGRHLLPGYLALVILVALGLAYGYDWRTGRIMRVIFTALTIFAAWVVVGNVTLVQAFQTITFPPEQVPELDGTHLEFGEAAFLGYQLDQPVLQADERPEALLCWQSLRADETLPIPYAFAFQLVDHQNTIYAGRESFTGMGKYTNWQPNRAFCDRFQLNIQSDLLPARGYKVAVSLFEPETIEGLPENNGQSPFVGWMASPGETLPAAEQAAAAFDFGGLYLLDYALETTANGIDLTLHWGTGEWQAKPVTLFVHVQDSAGDLVGQLDMPLGEEIYPAFLWGKHERTFDATYPIAIEGDAGEYTVFVGLYDPNTLDRLPVTDAAGSPYSDGRAPLDSVTRE
jgi:hypothetical protein